MLWLVTLVASYATVWPLVHEFTCSKDKMSRKTETEKKLSKVLSKENWGASSTQVKQQHEHTLPTPDLTPWSLLAPRGPR